MNIAKRFGLTAEEPHPLELAAVANPLRGVHLDESDPNHPLSSQKEAGVAFSGLKPLGAAKVAAGGKSLLTATLITQQQQAGSSSQHALGLRLSEIVRFASAAPDSISTAEFGQR